MDLTHQEEGQGLLEYGLAIVLVATAVVAILTLLGPPISGLYARVIAGMNGQTVQGVGDEVVADETAVVTEAGGNCTLTLPAGSRVIPLRDGRPLGDTSVTVTIWASGNSGGSDGVSTNRFGIGNTSADISASAPCPAAISYTMTEP